MLQAGDAVPDFTLTAEPAATVSKSGLLGTRYLLYFYPADDTPGCTKEACAFRDNLPRFGALGVPVYGISPDDGDSHGKFRAKYSLNFPLLSDPEHRFAEACGAWGEKNLYGRVFMGVIRSSFLIGPDGRVEKAWPKVSPEIHAAEVLTHLGATAAPAKAAAKPASRAAAAKPAPRKKAVKRPVRKAVKRASPKPPRKPAKRKAGRRK